MKLGKVVLHPNATLRRFRNCYVRGDNLGIWDVGTLVQSFEHPVFYEGVGSWPHTKWKFKDPFDPKVALDIGGGIGGFAARTKKLFPKCKVISIEPVHENRLLHELTLRELSPDRNWELIDGVLNYFPESTKFFNHKHYSTTGRLVPKNDLLKYTERYREYEGFSAKSFTLKELIDLAGGRVDILKMDCEGGENGLMFNEDGEYFVHPDIELMKDIPIITGEWHQHEVPKPRGYYCNSKFVNTLIDTIGDTHNVISHDPAAGDGIGNFFCWKKNA